MKWSEVILRKMLDIVAICIVLHNLCIIDNEKTKDEWIA